MADHSTYGGDLTEWQEIVTELADKEKSPKSEQMTTAQV